MNNLNQYPGVHDPNHTSAPDQSVGGKSKVRATDKSGESYQGASGYGFMVNGPEVMPNGKVNGTTLPVAKPIEPMTSGDPNNTSC